MGVQTFACWLDEDTQQLSEWVAEVVTTIAYRVGKERGTHTCDGVNCRGRDEWKYRVCVGIVKFMKHEPQQ